jgi:TonB-linked SusC/RagA family outer membrane protein
MKKNRRQNELKQSLRKAWAASLLGLIFMLIGATAMAQRVNVSGSVKNTSGEAVPGVTIVVKGTSNGVVSDNNGNFSIRDIASNAVLQFSFVGMKNQDIQVGGKTVINIIMEDESIGLGEVVAVGYGSMKKEDVTGAVASVSRNEILANPYMNAVQSIQGKVSGIDIYSTSSKPGDSPTIRVRGNRSIKASNDPLYVVDGIPFEGNLKDVNSADIESIEILKDASATAIYGSRGANGVILVTTRKGKAGKTEVSWNSYYGVQINNDYNLMSPAKFVEMRRWAQRNAGKYASDVPKLDLDKTMFYYPDKYVIESISAAYDENGNYDPSKIRSYDWVGAISQTGIIQDHQLSILGGNEKTKISFSAGYFDNQGAIKGFGYQKYSLRLSIDQIVNNWLTVGGSMASSFNLKKESNNSLFSYAAQTNPLNPFTDENEVLQLFPGGELWPNAKLVLENDFLNYKANRFYGSYYAEIKLPAGLRYRLNFGPDYQDGRNGYFYGSKGSRLGGSATATSSMFNQFHYTLDNLLYYNKTIKEVHKVGVTLLQSIEEYKYENLSGGVDGLPYEYQKWFNLGTATSITSIGSNYSRWGLNSYMARLNYSFKERYLFTLTGRYDGSSRLAEGHKYTFFPSAAFSWRITEEPFMADVKMLDNLKLRMGYGETGNTSISPYETLGSLTRTTYANGDSGFLGYAPNTLVNSSLRWETTAQYDLGLDFSLFKGKLSGTVDVYRQNTSNLLLPRQLPIASGFSTITQNIGSTRNTGLEVTLSGVILQTPGGFKWDADLMFSTNKEEITKLYYGKVDDIGNKWFIGKPVNTFYDYKADGIWQDSDEDKAKMAVYNAAGSSYAPGEIRIYDRDDNKKINSDDRMILGSAVPKWTGSITSNMEYKGFDFSFFIYTRQGQMHYDVMLANHEARYSGIDVDYWTPLNHSNSWPRPLAGRQEALNYTTLCYQDGSFIKLKTVSLGYSLPNKISSKMDISKVRVYITAQNPYMYKNCWSIDPESPGLSVPSVKTFIGGISVSF